MTRLERKSMLSTTWARNSQNMNPSSPRWKRYVVHISLDHSKAQAIPTISYYVVNLQIGSHQVYFWETFTLREDCEMASFVIRVRHLICISESNQRKCHCKIPCRSNCKRVWANEVWIFRWRSLSHLPSRGWIYLKRYMEVILRQSI